MSQHLPTRPARFFAVTALSAPTDTDVGIIAEHFFRYDDSEVVPTIPEIEVVIRRNNPHVGRIKVVEMRPFEGGPDGTRMPPGTYGWFPLPQGQIFGQAGIRTSLLTPSSDLAVPLHTQALVLSTASGAPLVYVSPSQIPPGAELPRWLRVSPPLIFITFPGCIHKQVLYAIISR